MSDGINYRSLLLEIGTFTQSELNKVDQAMPQLIESESISKEKARQWLQVSVPHFSLFENCNLN